MNLRPVADSLPNVLLHNAIHFPERIVYRFLPFDGDQSPIEELTYFELYTHVQTIAHTLLKADLRGERALFAPGPDYLRSSLSCLTAGVIAVPAYPPDRNGRTSTRLETIAADCTPKVAIRSTKTPEFVGSRSRRKRASGQLDQ